ncbi:MAG TPA: hypothetical protein VG328_10465 [Stellaceae bacterium]|jgi:hypothetical protein|nr:hypothetical protein [Stellaceae bacterium]
MDSMRWVFSIGTGAVIGIAAALALELSFRLMRGPAAAAVPAGPHVPLLARPWPVRVAIVVFATAFYTIVGYQHRPLPIAPPATATNDAPTVSDTTPQTETSPASFDIGGVTLTFAPPQGTCLYPAALLEAVRLQQGKLNPDNVIDGAFGDCGQLRNTVANQTRIRDFGLLMTPKADLDQRVDRAMINRMAGAMQDQTSIKATLDQRLAGAESKLALQSFSALGSIDSDPQAVYFAYLSKAQGAEGAFTQACVMALTAVNGRLVSYYLYSDYEKDPRPVIFNLLAKVKAGVNDFAQRNRT